MSSIRDSIKKALNDKEEISKKVITLNLDDELVTDVDKIAKVFTELNKSKTFSRNSIIEMALKTFVDETANMLSEEYGIELEDKGISNQDEGSNDYDLVIFPAHNDGFKETFIGEDCWYAVRIKEDRIPKIKYVAIYRAAPVSGITHYAKVKDIVQYKDTNKRIIYFEGKAIELGKTVILGESDANSMRAPRYTTKEKLLKATEVSHLFL